MLGVHLFQVIYMLALLQVIRVTAKDEADFGVNADVEYVKNGGNGSELFSVGKTTGWVSVAGSSLAGRLLETYTLVVRAVDKGVPPQSDQTVVTLVITGENRYSPVFTTLSYQVNKNDCYI
jgi:protocadherin Fat 4